MFKNFFEIMCEVFGNFECYFYFSLGIFKVSKFFTQNFETFFENI